MRILILSDGKPGHFKKSEAVAKAIQLCRPAEVEWLDIHLRWHGYHSILKRWFSWRGQLPSTRWLPWFYDMPEPPQMRPDLIVSSGGKTCIANAWLATAMHCPNVFIGDTRGLSPDLFDHILTPDTRFQQDARYIIGVPPTTIDPQELREAAEAYLADREDDPQIRYWTLLIGGSTNCRSFAYSRSEWTRLADGAATLAEQHGIRWLITTSRRTGRTAENVFSRHRRLQPHIEDLCLYGKDDRKIFNAFLACADTVFCTEDSATMLTEAVASARPVFSVRPQQARHSRTLENLLNYYVQEKRIKRITIPELARLSGGDVSARLHPPVPEATCTHWAADFWMTFSEPPEQAPPRISDPQRRPRNNNDSPRSPHDNE